MNEAYRSHTRHKRESKFSVPLERVDDAKVAVVVAKMSGCRVSYVSKNFKLCKSRGKRRC